MLNNCLHFRDLLVKRASDIIEISLKFPPCISEDIPLVLHVHVVIALESVVTNVLKQFEIKKKC